MWEKYFSNQKFETSSHGLFVPSTFFHLKKQAIQIFSCEVNFTISIGPTKNRNLIEDLWTPAFVVRKLQLFFETFNSVWWLLTRKEIPNIVSKLVCKHLRRSSLNYLTIRQCNIWAAYFYHGNWNVLVLILQPTEFIQNLFIRNLPTTLCILLITDVRSKIIRIIIKHKYISL